MNLNRYLILLILLVKNISIHSQPAKACDDSSGCVKNRVQDFLISEHIRAKALRIDTALLIKQKNELKGIISYQDENTKALNKINFDLNQINLTYKTDYTKLQVTSDKFEQKASRRGRFTWALIGVALIETVIILFKP